VCVCVCVCVCVGVGVGVCVRVEGSLRCFVVVHERQSLQGPGLRDSFVLLPSRLRAKITPSALGLSCHPSQPRERSHPERASVLASLRLSSQITTHTHTHARTHTHTLSLHALAL
jgi:hypothetical protein